MSEKDKWDELAETLLPCTNALGCWPDRGVHGWGCPANSRAAVAAELREIDQRHLKTIVDYMRLEKEQDDELAALRNQRDHWRMRCQQANEDLVFARAELEKLKTNRFNDGRV